jgi:hypothetical protein
MSHPPPIRDTFLTKLPLRPAMSFLALPAELRNQIYSLIVIPDVAEFSPYAGLYMICHQIAT